MRCCSAENGREQSPSKAYDLCTWSLLWSSTTQWVDDSQIPILSPDSFASPF
jgi:hypothetical protein